MKKILFLVSVFFLSAVSAHAQDGSSGCGLGWEVAKEQSILSSAIRASTNATFLNTIAMTFGTSGCAKHSIVMKEKAANYYAEANYHKLMVEMAEGRGEYLASFADVLGCDGAAFSQTMQKNYGTIFSSGSTTPVQMLQNVKQAIHSANLSCQS